MSDFHRSLDRALDDNPLAEHDGAWCPTCDAKVSDRDQLGRVTVRECPVCPPEPTC